MNSFIKLGKKLLFLPVWVMLLFALVSAGSLVFVFLKGLEESIIAYFVYVFAFYTLSVICIFCAKVLPDRFKRAKQKVYANKYGNKYMTDGEFRTHVSLYVSLCANLLYAGANVYYNFRTRSYWFGILAGYYIILAVMRFLLLRYINKNQIGENLLGEWKRARICACILTLINLVLSGAILMIMYQGKGFEYKGMLIYVMAMYTFYITALAIKNIIKYRKYNSPVIRTTKIITLAAALVSMLSLETAMLNAFGAETEGETKRILIAATGAGISIIILAMSSYMIIRSAKEIEKIQEKKHDESR